VTIFGAVQPRETVVRSSGFSRISHPNHIRKRVLDIVSGAKQARGCSVKAAVQTD
jgi:hypothetical protein